MSRDKHPFQRNFTRRKSCNVCGLPEDSSVHGEFPAGVEDAVGRALARDRLTVFEDARFDPRSMTGTRPLRPGDKR